MAIVVGKYILTNKHGQVLSDRVSKVRPEHAHIKATTITHSENGLGGNLICNPQPRCESLVLSDVAVQPVRSVARDPNDPFDGIGKPTLPLAGNGFGKVIFVT